MTWTFIIGLVVAGATAIPLGTEVDAAANWLGGSDKAAESGPVGQIVKVQEALHVANSKYPFMAYGTDWLAFGHFVIAVAYIGALRDPVRNKWLFTFGMIACVMVVPYAFIMGGIRDIPVWWRMIDSSFGIVGIIPVWLCRKWVTEIEFQEINGASETKGKNN